MDYKKLSAWGLIAVAAYLTVVNIMDAWTDVLTWHGAISIFTPAFVAATFKLIAPGMFGALGGSLLPQWGPPPAGVVDRRSPAPPATVGLLLVLVLSLGLVGCGQTLVQLSATSESLVHSSIQASEKLHADRALTDQQFKDVNVILNRVAVAGLTFTNLIDLKTAKVSDAAAFLIVLQKAITDIKASFPQPAVQNVVSALQSVVDKVTAIQKLLTT